MKTKSSSLVSIQPAMFGRRKMLRVQDDFTILRGQCILKSWTKNILSLATDHCPKCVVVEALTVPFAGSKRPRATPQKQPLSPMQTQTPLQLMLCIALGDMRLYSTIKIPFIKLVCTLLLLI